MGVELAESGLAHVSVDTGSEENGSMLHEKENGHANQIAGFKEPIKFGSHGADEPVKLELSNIPEANFPKDAVDEWPEPKQIHSIYFAKYRSYDDQKLKFKLDQSDKELQRKNQARSQIIEKLKAQREERAGVIAQLRSLGEENKQFRSIVGEKRKEMEPLQQALGKLRGSNYAGREKGVGLCSSEEELNDLIKSLNYRIQHESIPLAEEKQLLREIKLLEGTREKVVANAAIRAKIQDSMGEKEAIQDQVKLIGVDLDGVRREQQVIKSRVKQLEDVKEAIDKEINSLQEELTSVTQKRDKTFETIQGLRKQREEQNACFYQNRTLLTKAKDIAAGKDIEALRELSNTEFDRFLSLWNSSKDIRGDYERRILPSLDIRQLSKDGRMRNPDERPLVSPEAPIPTETEMVAKPNVKQVKEESMLPQNSSSVDNAQKGKHSKPQKEAKDKLTETTLEKSDLEVREEISGSEKLQKNPPKGNEVDEAKLKEMKREEEMEKKRLALERKKKLAEKAAAKAAIKAQKEAEKKLKEREKRAKKKAGASVAAPEPGEVAEAAEEVAELEQVNETAEASFSSKNKDRKEPNIRYRGRSRGGQDSFPKVVLKRKKSTNYWVWAAAAAAAAALLVLTLVAFGYNYVL